MECIEYLIMARRHQFHCPQCGNRTVADSIGMVTDTHWLYANDDDPDSAMPFYEYYEVIRCVSCNEILIYCFDERNEENPIEEGTLLYPLKRSLPNGIPEAIAREFHDAQKFENSSNPAFAVFIGRTLERLVRDKGAVGKNLFEQIEDLSAKGIIPQTLCEMGHTLRFLRNKGAHVSDYEIEDNEVEAMRDFVMTMLEYVYVAPAKLAALKTSIERKTKGLSQKDSEP